MDIGATEAVAALSALVISDQAVRGRLPVEISGRGVRYAPKEEVDGVSDFGAVVADRLDDLEAGLEALRLQSERSQDLSNR